MRIKNPANTAPQRGPSERRVFIHALTGEMPEKPIDFDAPPPNTAPAASRQPKREEFTAADAARRKAEKAAWLDRLAKPRVGFAAFLLAPPRRTSEAVIRRDAFLDEHGYKPRTKLQTGALNSAALLSPRKLPGTPTTREEYESAKVHLRHCYKTGKEVPARFKNLAPPPVEPSADLYWREWEPGRENVWPWKKKK